ncbi:hypothetical protein GOP47_0007348 [Adiantum capillus-veneris]|uniref:RRM domain-containing protein n=1 Tax=Adiantum capillus-veneris TaxID=13818 RepID=A0A9D4V0U4_ADICA|nr:hypothetical protein GOP47_0007348 [Adiantum capillus-veneris]
MMMQPGAGVGPSPNGVNIDPQQQQQWAMAAPMQGMAGMQPQQLYVQCNVAPGPQNADDIRTLWVGDLQFWMDENYIASCFAHTGEVLNVKIIRNKQTMASEGYGFVEFVSHTSAERILNTYNGAPMPQTEQAFRLNWASFGMGERRMEGSDLSIFVGDLAGDVTDQVLQETFKSRYASVKGARVVTDTLTGRSKGYGFVRFGDDAERTRSMTEMNGVYCSSRPMRINVATPKKALNQQQQFNAKASSSTYQGYGSSAQGSSENDPNNTTVFVGGLDPNVKDQDLRHIFGQYGELVSVKIPVGKGCGFVQFVNRSAAEEAIQKLHGSLIGQQTVRLSWGRSPANKQPGQYGGWNQAQSDPSQWNPGYYTYNQGYEGYGYAPNLQDGSAYGYSSYPSYGTYPQQAF